MTQQVPPGWTPQGPQQQHGQHPGYAGPHRPAQQYGWPQQQQPRPTSNRTLYVVLGVVGGFFLLSTCGGMMSAIVASAESTPSPVTIPTPSPTPVAEPESNTRSPSGSSLDATEFRTKPGYVIATSKDKVEKAVALVAAGDRVAFGRFLNSTPGVSLTAGNDVVTVVDSGGVFGSVIRIRKRGETASFWTVREALER